MSLTVELRGVGRVYGRREALSGVSCRFKPGRVNVMLGPNGSGKTTLLRLAAGLEPPDGGSVEYFDGETGLMPGVALMRRMTLVSQKPVLFNTTVFKNVAYGLRQRGVGEAEVERRALEALDLVGMGAFAYARAVSLSGGEAQRVAIARAFALSPELIFLDEPSASLDPDGGAVFESIINKMNSDLGTTVVLVTHNLFQARRLAHMVYFMYGGRLVEWDKAERLFEHPQNPSTARFISGEMVF